MHELNGRPISRRSLLAGVLGAAGALSLPHEADGGQLWFGSEWLGGPAESDEDGVGSGALGVGDGLAEPVAGGAPRRSLLAGYEGDAARLGEFHDGEGSSRFGKFEASGGGSGNLGDVDQAVAGLGFGSEGTAN